MQLLYGSNRFPVFSVEAIPPADEDSQQEKKEGQADQEKRLDGALDTAKKSLEELQRMLNEDIPRTLKDFGNKYHLRFALEPVSLDDNGIYKLIAPHEPDLAPEPTVIIDADPSGSGYGRKTGEVR